MAGARCSYMSHGVAYSLDRCSHPLAVPCLQPVYSVRDVTTGRYKIHALKGEEVAIVDQVSFGDW